MNDRDDEPCLCDTDFTCMAIEHDEWTAIDQWKAEMEKLTVAELIALDLTRPAKAERKSA